MSRVIVSNKHTIKRRNQCFVWLFKLKIIENCIYNCVKWLECEENNVCFFFQFSCRTNQITTIMLGHYTLFVLYTYNIEVLYSELHLEKRYGLRLPFEMTHISRFQDKTRQRARHLFHVYIQLYPYIICGIAHKTFHLYIVQVHTNTIKVQRCMYMEFHMKSFNLYKLSQSVPVFKFQNHFSKVYADQSS